VRGSEKWGFNTITTHYTHLNVTYTRVGVSADFDVTERHACSCGIRLNYRRYFITSTSLISGFFLWVLLMMSTHYYTPVLFCRSDSH
jgi:hypothetical protein